MEGSEAGRAAPNGVHAAAVEAQIEFGDARAAARRDVTAVMAPEMIIAAMIAETIVAETMIVEAIEGETGRAKRQTAVVATAPDAVAITKWPTGRSTATLARATNILARPGVPYTASSTSASAAAAASRRTLPGPT